MKNPERLHGARLLDGDVRNPITDLISHSVAPTPSFASQPSPISTPPTNTPKEAVSVNVYGSDQVVEAARRNHVHRLVFCRSTTVYGTPASTPVTERHMTHPLNLYGVTKLAERSSSTLLTKTTVSRQ